MNLLDEKIGLNLLDEKIGLNLFDGKIGLNLFDGKIGLNLFDGKIGLKVNNAYHDKIDENSMKQLQPRSKESEGLSIKNLTNPFRAV